MHVGTNKLPTTELWHRAHKINKNLWPVSSKYSGGVVPGEGFAMHGFSYFATNFGTEIEIHIRLKYHQYLGNKTKN